MKIISEPDTLQKTHKENLKIVPPCILLITPKQYLYTTIKISLRFEEIT
jgi:hypothetical protein